MGTCSLLKQQIYPSNNCALSVPYRVWPWWHLRTIWRTSGTFRKRISALSHVCLQCQRYCKILTHISRMQPHINLLSLMTVLCTLWSMRIPIQKIRKHMFVGIYGSADKNNAVQLGCTFRTFGSTLKHSSVSSDFVV